MIKKAQVDIFIISGSVKLFIILWEWGSLKLKFVFCVHVGKIGWHVCIKICGHVWDGRCCEQ